MFAVAVLTYPAKPKALSALTKDGREDVKSIVSGFRRTPEKISMVTLLSGTSGALQPALLYSERDSLTTTKEGLC